MFLSETECVHILNQLFRQAKLSEYNFGCLYQVFSQHALHLLYNWEHAVVTYNIQKCFIIDHKNICANHFTWLGPYFMGYCILLWLCILVFQTCCAMFYCVFYISIHVKPLYVFIHKQPHLLNSHVVAVQLVQILHLLLRRYYYSFASHNHTIYHEQVLSDGPIFLCSQQCMIYGMKSCRCASWAVASCMSCMGVHTGRSTVVLIVLTFKLRPCIPLSLFSSWLQQDNQSAIYSSGP